MNKSKIGGRMNNVVVKYCSNDSQHIIGIDSTVLSIMQLYKQKNYYDLEAGGQLFVEYVGEVDIISRISLPNKLDIRKRNLFKPHIPSMQKTIDSQYKMGFHYIGDWHTHFELHPSPSKQDLKSIHSRYKDSIHELKNMVIIIVGKGENDLYVAFSNGKDIIELKPIE